MKFTPIILAIVTSTVMVFAQDANKEAATGPSYRLQTLYRGNVAQTYTLTEETSVVRTMNDSSKTEYSRLVTYYLAVRCLSSIDGISNLSINIDSMVYSFSADGQTIDYNSQVDITPKSFADLNNYVGPLNRSFEITMSPYGEVSKLEGEQVQFWRDYLTENAADLDSVVYLIWMQSLDRENLLQYGDLQKRVIPGKRLPVESSWNHNLTLRVDGVVYQGDAKATFESYEDGFYKLAVVDTIPAAQQEIHVYGIPYVSKVLEGAAAVDHRINLATTGTINDVTSTVNSWVRCKASNQVFIQKVKSTTTWTLTGQFQW